MNEVEKALHDALVKMMASFLALGGAPDWQEYKESLEALQKVEER